MSASAEVIERPRVPLIGRASGSTVDDRRRPLWWSAVGAVVLVALLLRLWGVAQGLPFAYNSDEYGHFVPQAIGMFGHSLEPGTLGAYYFDNPPAYTYLLHIVFAVWFGSGSAVEHTFANNPTEVWVVARVTAGVLGTIAVWLLYIAGARLFDRRVGLLAAALESVAFLPVFYAHLALNDVPTLAPITLSLLGTAGVLRYGRPLDYLLAGIGLGLGCATKYTAGIMLIPLVTAAATQYLQPGGERGAIIGVVLAGAAAAVFFVIANPYALLDFSAFHQSIDHQQSVSSDGIGKLGTTQNSGIVYYLWTFTWGLGWVPAFAALGGVVMLWRDERRLVVLLAPTVVLYLIYMGTQSRYFGRWLLPVFPVMCLLGAYCVLELAEVLARRRPALRPTLIALAAVALCGQGLVYSIHSGLVDSRPDTRNLTRSWMVAHIPVGSDVVVEPVVPDSWVQDIGRVQTTRNGDRWEKYLSLTQQPVCGGGSAVNIEDYEKTLCPGLVGYYEKMDYCWVVTGSTQFGRAFAQPYDVPEAIAYYRELARVGQLVYSASPYSPGKGPVAFDFDWAFDYYPLAYERPGPVMNVYHLTGGACAPSAITGAAGLAGNDVPSPTVQP
ncbi:MAG TPA: glycosyltransferase family 39 protein [Solirubrobacteraceae bacterium]|jgi:4-amino-4-deoxy-L-arabinose transferase-like glycosyltransferase|nr:glycosyltransferase family 39 protein [Solirubrobacteraceae bacterium]